MEENYCYSNCSVLIPRQVIWYSGGDLAVGIILTALLVTGISVIVHVAVFYWVYKKILKPRVLAENSVGNDVKKCGNDPAYEDVIYPQDVPVINRNEAYRSTVRQSLPILCS